MPIYEYRCRDCGRKTSFLVLNPNKPLSPKCPKCGSTDMHRLFSRFSSPLSEDRRLEKLADPSFWGDIDENDPASIAKFVKKMGKELGEDLGEDFEEIAEEAAREAEGGGDEVDEVL